MDEPTSSLDPESARSIEALAKFLKTWKTALWVTHQHDQAQNIADKVLVLDKGKIVSFKSRFRVVEQKNNPHFSNAL
jgi:ABC-type phosphate transport system ATPase subunit